MDVLQGFSAEPFQHAALQSLVSAATQSFVAFTLVIARLSGLFVIAPAFGHPDIPLQIRVLLVVALSLLITPALLSLPDHDLFTRLDLNEDYILTADEVPPQLAAHVEQLQALSGRPAHSGLAAADFDLPLPNPQTPADYAWLATGEFGIGLALGLGILTIISGLQLAGLLLDQQTGTSLGELFNPALDSSVSVSGELLYALGTLLFLLVGGHLLATSALVNTYQTLPLGFAFVNDTAIQMLSQLVQESLALAIQVSAPLIISMAVVGLAMGFLGHTIPQINVLVVGFPVRAIVGLIVLGLALSGMGEAMVRSLPVTIEQLQRSLSGF